LVDDIITAGIGGNGATQPGIDETQLPGTLDLVDDSDTGRSNTDNVTSDATPGLRGQAPANTTIVLRSSLGGEIGRTVADENGNWSFDAGLLPDGIHELTATPLDGEGNEGVPSLPLTVTIDTEAPAAPNAPAHDGGLIDTADRPLFKGKAEPGAHIVLTSDKDGILGEVVADENGNWQIVADPLSENAHSLTVTASDTAGNTSAPSEALQIQVLGDTALNFDANDIIRADAVLPNGSLRFEPVNLASLLSGFYESAAGGDEIADALSKSPASATQALGFTRQLQMARSNPTVAEIVQGAG